MADKLPGDGFLGWLGRQVGYVKKAVKVDPKPATLAAGQTAQAPNAGTASKAETRDAKNSTVLYREDRVEEARHPDNPDLWLRRTVIDEVIQEPADDGHSRR